jgi:hypothetical protein
LTFLLVALLANMRWAYWPAGALGVFGFFLFFQSQINLFSYFRCRCIDPDRRFYHSAYAAFVINRNARYYLALPLESKTAALSRRFFHF